MLAGVGVMAVVRVGVGVGSSKCASTAIPLAAVGGAREIFVTKKLPGGRVKIKFRIRGVRKKSW